MSHVKMWILTNIGLILIVYYLVFREQIIRNWQTTTNVQLFFMSFVFFFFDLSKFWGVNCQPFYSGYVCDSIYIAIARIFIGTVLRLKREGKKKRPSWGTGLFVHILCETYAYIGYLIWWDWSTTIY